MFIERFIESSIGALTERLYRASTEISIADSIGACIGVSIGVSTGASIEFSGSIVLSNII